MFASLLKASRPAVASPAVRQAFLLAAAGHLLGAQMFQTLAPLFVADALGFQGGEYGLFVAVRGLGAVAASFVSTVMAHDRQRWMVAGAFGVAGSLGLLAASNSAAAAFGLAGATGFR